MPRITDAGLVRTTQAQYQARALDAFRAALGDNMQTGADTVQGIISRGFAAMLGDIESAVLYRGNGFNPATMIGRQLDDYAVGFQLTRKAATKSTGTVTLSGTQGTVIPEGSEVSTASGDIFVTDAEGTIPAGGTVDVAVTAEKTGVIQANAASITQIIDVRPGWTGVTNAAAVTAGRAEEKDDVFRARIESARDRNAFGTIAAVRSRLLDVDDVTYATVLENRGTSSTTTKGILIDAGGIAAVVYGGTDADVAEAIYLSTVPGQVFSGSTSETHTPADAPSDAVTVKFTKASEVAAKIVLAISGDDTFPGDGLTQIRTNLLALWAGTFKAGTFVSSPIGVGDLPSTDHMRTAIGQTSGVTITSLALQKKSDSTAITSVDADELITLASADISITYTAL